MITLSADIPQPLPEHDFPQKRSWLWLVVLGALGVGAIVASRARRTPPFGGARAPSGILCFDEDDVGIMRKVMKRLASDRSLRPGEASNLSKALEVALDRSFDYYNA